VYADDEWMSVRQAALALGIAPQTVYSRAVSGELEFTRLAGYTFISRASVEQALSAK
jgi:excisionase family DNA binding protein